MIVLKQKPQSCPICNNDRLEDTKKDYPINEQTTVDLAIIKCPSCGAVFVLYETLWRRIEDPDKIKRIMEESEDEEIRLRLERLELQNCVAEFRKKAKITQVQLARRLGKPPQRIYEIEKVTQAPKAPKIDVALKIARALGCDVNDIFKLVPKKDGGKDDTKAEKNEGQH